MTQRIEKSLKKALIDNGEMSFSLYELELHQDLNFWKNQLQEDDDDYLIVATEYDENVSMLFFEKSGAFYVNELARQKFRSLWSDGIYEKNMNTQVIPFFAERIKAGFIAAYGLKIELPTEHQLELRKF
jgi:hypothetical protein